VEESSSWRFYVAGEEGGKRGSRGELDVRKRQIVGGDRSIEDTIATSRMCVTNSAHARSDV
jgi:hypothetical protein